LCSGDFVFVLKGATGKRIKRKKRAQ